MWLTRAAIRTGPTKHILKRKEVKQYSFSNIDAIAERCNGSWRISRSTTITTEMTENKRHFDSSRPCHRRQFLFMWKMKSFGPGEMDEIGSISLQKGPAFAFASTPHSRCDAKTQKPKWDRVNGRQYPKNAAEHYTAYAFVVVHRRRAWWIARWLKFIQAFPFRIKVYRGRAA